MLLCDTIWWGHRLMHTPMYFQDLCQREGPQPGDLCEVPQYWPHTWVGIYTMFLSGDQVYNSARSTFQNPCATKKSKKERGESWRSWFLSRASLLTYYKQNKSPNRLLMLQLCLPYPIWVGSQPSWANLFSVPTTTKILPQILAWPFWCPIGVLWPTMHARHPK